MRPASCDQELCRHEGAEVAENLPSFALSIPSAVTFTSGVLSICGDGPMCSMLVSGCCAVWNDWQSTCNQAPRQGPYPH